VIYSHVIRSVRLDARDSLVEQHGIRRQYGRNVSVKSIGERSFTLHPIVYVHYCEPLVAGNYLIEINSVASALCYVPIKLRRCIVI